MPPKVSVIVPNYNHAKFLPQRLDSILAQTYTGFELIILDDKSTDNSREIIETYQGHSAVKQIVFNEVNSGSSFAQWNKGISLASGEYIWLAESDDITEKNFLEKLVPVLNAHPGVDLVYSQSYDMDEQGNVSGTCLKLTEKLDAEKWKHDYIAPGKEEIKKYMLYINIIPNASAVLFRRIAWERAGQPDASYKLNGDWKFWVELLLNADLAYLAQPLNYFRTHKQNVRSKAINEGLNYYEYARILEFIFSHLSFSVEEKHSTITYFNGEMNFNAPITFHNLWKSYFKLAKYDLVALKFFLQQIKHRYF